MKKELIKKDLSCELDQLDLLPESLTTGEASKLCGVSVRTVNRWIKKGLIKANRLPGNGNYRITKLEFSKFLLSNNLANLPHFTSISPEISQEKLMSSAESKAGSLRILIVEDEIQHAELMKNILVDSGYQVQISNSGFDAAIKIFEFEPHLITLDLNMPGLNGFYVLERIKKLKLNLNPLIVVVSGEKDEVIEKSLFIGADCYIKKPFRSKTLVENIDNLIKTEGLESQNQTNVHEIKKAA